MATDLENKLVEQRRRTEAGEALERVGTPTSVMSFLTHPSTVKQLSRLLGSEEMADRWLRVGLTEMQRIEKLRECSWESFAGALMLCAQLKLEPGPPLGLAWILPYENKVKIKNVWTKRLDAQFQLGYPGIVQLAHRSAQLATIAAHEVCDGDEFSFDYLTGDRHHRPPYKGERGDWYGIYCYAKYANGGEHFLYMTREQVMAHAERFSRAYQYDLKRVADGSSGISPWTTDPIAMARKTVIKASRPFLPASAEFIQAARADESVLGYQSGRPVIDDAGFEVALSAPQREELPASTDAETGEKREATPEEKTQGLPGINGDA